VLHAVAQALQLNDVDRLDASVDRARTTAATTAAPSRP
jgi:hypothetical protein